MKKANCISMLFLLTCNNSVQEPEGYESRLYKEAARFCTKLNNCTSAKVEICMSTFDDVQVVDKELELQKLIVFIDATTCDDLKRLVYFYRVGGQNDSKD